MGRAYKSQLKVTGTDGKAVKVKTHLGAKDGPVKGTPAPAASQTPAIQTEFGAQMYEEKQDVKEAGKGQKMTEIADNFKKARLKIVKSHQELTPRAAQKVAQKKAQETPQ